MPKVFITREIPSAAIDLLRKHGHKVTVYRKDSPISAKELLKNIKDSDAVISLLTEKFDKALIDQLKNCKVIANYAVGYNNIDVEYAKKKNIIVTNTPDVLTDSTADLTLALILACARRIVEAEKFLRAKKYKGWKPNLLLGMELKNNVLGILGAGRIGTAVAIRAKAFGMKIVYSNKIRNEILEVQTKAKKISIDNLLKTSDIVSVHLPLNSKTFHFLNKEKLNLMKTNSILVNASRGEVIDEKELIKLLKKKKISCAGLDVFENEPNLNDEFYKLNNVVILPHIGSATTEARTNMALLAAKNVIAVLSGKKAITPV
ncbi:MAG: D-glycerate dehydrogenase [Bacteroidetes bacterium]|nr:D-glycerate dehydrogenase [Bacteroidota bacterium]